MKKVSIIVPVYNVEKYLPKCLDSLIAQSYKNLEIILINDGSTDSSGQICERYKNLDNRIILINQQNQGAAVAKNAGLDVMTGDYFTFVDSDDFVTLDRVESAVKVLEENNADVAECTEMRMYTDEMRDMDPERIKVGVYTAEKFLGQYLNSLSASLFWNKLFKARLAEGVRFHTERRCIDDEFFTYKLLCGADRIVKLDKCLYYYRQRISGAYFSKSNQLQITDDALEVMIERYRYVTKRFPKLAKIYIVHGTNILHYFANSFMFDEQTARKLKRIGRFYLAQQILHPCGLKTLKTAIRLLLIPKKQMLQNKIENTQQDADKYFS